jgi:uncharacterized protein
MAAITTPVVHLELHTSDASRARDVYTALCGWHPRRIETGHGSYLDLGIGGDVGGGIVGCSARRPLWLPYVEVEDVGETTDRARRLGAAILLEPREGPVGWRSVVATPAGGEIAFWQHK